ncbi:btk-binding protein-related [Anaeramoeba flamelloides]|uniref:Btk-binding protein-related n=1 Tax=Anaeramoeba flamelloides TaxID=1746091 RepID=A0ABQ8Y9A0_9EUKA|nr:btk-binding protein-related [Anaeramoeba flamelloides]
MPVSAQDKVTKIFTGIHASGFFFVRSKPDRLYACGRNQDGELGIDHNSLHRWVPAAVKNFKGSEILTEKKAVQLATGSTQTLVLTDQNELYGWGSQDITGIQKFCDCEIGTMGNQIPVHKALLGCRTKLTIDQIQKKLFGEKSINKEQTLSFLKWIYYDEISDIGKLEQTFNLLELTFPPSVDNTLEKDIAQLYKDDDSKDFKILVKIEDEENDEEEEDKYEEIPVHKFILYARSGLFRAMFDYVNEKENINKVQDYTNKSIESLEILIKYFYTNSIGLKTNQDPKLIVDELSDAVEYYKLNDQCNFEFELNNIKKQFELN